MPSPPPIPVARPTGGSSQIEGLARIIQSVAWHGPTTSRVRTTTDKHGERTPQKQPPSAQPPPAPPQRQTGAHPPKPIQTQRETFIFWATRPRGLPAPLQPPAATKNKNTRATFVLDTGNRQSNNQLQQHMRGHPRGHCWMLKERTQGDLVWFVQGR